MAQYETTFSSSVNCPGGLNPTVVFQHVLAINQTGVHSCETKQCPCYGMSFRVLSPVVIVEDVE